MKNQLVTFEAKQHLQVVENSLKNQISIFADYIDSTGKKSSGSKGLAMQINKRVKLHFSASRDEFTNSDIELLVAMQSKLIEIMRQGAKDGLTRDTIKKTIYAAIEKFAGLK